MITLSESYTHCADRTCQSIFTKLLKACAHAASELTRRKGDHCERRLSLIENLNAHPPAFAFARNEISRSAIERLCISAYYLSPRSLCVAILCMREETHARAACVNTWANINARLSAFAHMGPQVARCGL
jgi:hypothetical protein